MGTDIHLVAEVQTGEDEYGDKVWEMLPGPIIDCWACDGTGIGMTWEGEWPNRHKVSTGVDCTWCGPDAKYPSFGPEPDMPPGKHRDGWYTDRNYTVFGILADVRNGSGFAGCDLGDPVVPIAPDRGLPDDLSDAAYVWFRHHGGDHSDTWVMLSELLEHDWDQPIVHRGVDTEELTYVTQIQWTTTQREFCEAFLERVHMLAAEAGERPCRLSFNFDS